MDIPPASHPLWCDLALGKVNFDFEFLPTRIMLGNIVRSLSKDQSDANLRRHANDLWEMFAKNFNLPKVQRDLEGVLISGAYR